MNRSSTSFDVYSPRSGRADRYLVEFDVHQLHIKQDGFSATCTHVDHHGPEWSGYGGDMGNPLMRKFENDSVHAPSVGPEFIEWAWEQWREGEVSNEELQSALEQFFRWGDHTSRLEPTSDFLLRYL